MRLIPFLLTSLLTGLLIYGLNRPWGYDLPFALGSFVSPQHGFWRSAEPENEDFGGELKIPGLVGKVEVYLDDRLVPHVFAENDADLYAAQGFLHAKFRLFQMDLQTRAAAGRASEIAGGRAVEFDRTQRRLGMVYAAENALREMEKDPVSKRVFDAYTRGVNAYITSLAPEDWPLEYKLLHAEPEKWSNLRTALLLKMMAKTLSGGTETDLAYTRLKAALGNEVFGSMYQVVPDSLKPIVPRGTAFAPPGITPVQPASADSLYFGRTPAPEIREKFRPNPDNGSNNWVVAGARTRSGAPLLCNDPHLELSLPSIWYEMQLTDKNGTVYGVSLPGSPFIIIGFNDHIAWGITNAQRDVKDYYRITFKDKKKTAYRYNGKWEPTRLRPEEIRVKDGVTVYDTVAYTVFGPVMYEEGRGQTENLAVRWIAHDPSNEGMTFYKLNRAGNYADYAEAIKSFTCPGQNFIFASREGDIAVWQQGKFPARWQGQGLFIMPGEDDAYRWQGYIPQPENPHSLNPERGFLESANQRPVDKTYPYFIPGSYITSRAVSIEEKLDGMHRVTPEDMRKLLVNYDNVQAKVLRPVLLKRIREAGLDATGKKYLDIVRKWDLRAGPSSQGQTVFQVWIDSLETAIWNDEIDRVTPAAPLPDDQVLTELLLRDSTSRFYDNLHTTRVETLSDVITEAFSKAVPVLERAEKEGKLEWTRFKNPTIYHLLKEALPSFARRGLPVGGARNIINAVTHSHGPSWRMVVHLTKETEAFGVYPAGQHGNPGSRYYDDFVDTWAKGDLYKLWKMKKEEVRDERIKWRLSLVP